MVEKCSEVSFLVHSANVSQRPVYVDLGEHSIIETKFDDWILNPDPEIDLCCLPLNDVDSNAFYIPINKREIADKSVSERFSASLKAVMIGYPNGFWDAENGLPIIRHGYTASYLDIDFDGKEYVLIDMPCFKGSSGSPIILNDEKIFSSSPRFLGMLFSEPGFKDIGSISHLGN
ncbi:MAG: serine protease [Proteobacteria bacterium]|nr:serine protease [Pseudomonadota bacterium]